MNDPKHAQVAVAIRAMIAVGGQPESGERACAILTAKIEAQLFHLSLLAPASLLLQRVIERGFENLSGTA